MTDTTDIAARLAAAGLRVKPLDADNTGYWTADFCGRHYSVYPESLQTGHVFVARVGGKILVRGGKHDCIAACERHHAESVLAMLEPIPSEEPQP